MELKQLSSRDVGSRSEAAAYLAEALQGLYSGDPTPAPHPGGRQAGLTRLRVFNVGAYQARRNDVGPTAGASVLSPYLRHGCITLPEARRDAVEKIGSDRAYKFIQELAWRQFWQLQRERIGDRALNQDLETPKVPLGDGAVPDEVEAGETGLNCMDTSVRSLKENGYLFNHARMWMAAYLVHHRKVSWQAGAQFFYRYLLDGDPASNSLSWQWVASTFSHKPYFFNRENVEKYSRDPATGETYCTHCNAAKNHTCPFDASYATLGKRLFGPSYDNDNGYQRTGGDSKSGGSRGVAPRGSSQRR
ncbi:MAG: DNA photolyase [Cytophagales bacterium]|nr:DNA photolyase [Armatimonadota bacterium]